MLSVSRTLSYSIDVFSSTNHLHLADHFAIFGARISLPVSRLCSTLNWRRHFRLGFLQNYFEKFFRITYVETFYRICT